MAHHKSPFLTPEQFEEQVIKKYARNGYMAVIPIFDLTGRPRSNSSSMCTNAVPGRVVKQAGYHEQPKRKVLTVPIDAAYRLYEYSVDANRIPPHKRRTSVQVNADKRAEKNGAKSTAAPSAVDAFANPAVEQAQVVEASGDTFNTLRTEVQKLRDEGHDIAPIIIKTTHKL